MTPDMQSNICTLIHRTMQNFSGIELSEEEYHSLSKNIDSFPFLIAQNGVCKLERKEKHKVFHYYLSPICSYLEIKRKLVLLDENCVKLEIRYFDGSSIKEALVSREETLSRTGVKSLLGKGVSFDEVNCRPLISYLLRSDQQASVDHVHSHLGWLEKDGVQIFRGHQSFSTNPNFAKSHYRGSLDIKPSGAINRWLSMVKLDVLPYTPLTFCLLLGFSAPLLSLLYQKFDLGCLVFNLANKSSKGKTTSAMLAASVFSNPALGKGTVQSFHATSNYLIDFFAQASGFPVVLDEGATFSGDFTQFFYLVTAGRDKGRLGRDSLVKETFSWNNVLLTTAEFFAVNDNSPDGLHTRCFSLTDDMTQDAAHADRIKTIINENYGLAGNTFLEWILTQSDIELEKDYLDCIRILHDKLKNMNMKPSPFTSRIFSKLAIVLQVADYVSQCFEIDFDTEKLAHYIVQIERRVNTESNPVQKVLDTLLSEVSRSSSHYISNSNLNPENTVGKIEQKDDVKYISILKPEFNRICLKNNLQPTIILKDLKDQQLLDCESDRLSKRVRLKRTLPEQACYVLKIKDPDVSICEHKSINF